MTTTLKTCSVCGQAKPLDDFYRHRATKDRRVAMCKLCSSDYARAYNLARKYGLTPDALQLLLVKQEHLCAICREPLIKIKVDHDHTCCPGDITCGKCVRGLLCNGCNTAIGMLKDSPIVLSSAIEYLSSPPAVGMQFTPYTRQKV